jgi:predicted nucleic acid-binding protein
MHYFDTYALIQIAKGDKNYLPFIKTSIATTLLNLYELYYILSKEKKEQLAENFFDRLLPFCVDFSSEDIKTAAKFRLEHQKKSLSYVDALGYVISLRLGAQFLTGDDAFAQFPGVLFVK